MASTRPSAARRSDLMRGAVTDAQRQVRESRVVADLFDNALPDLADEHEAAWRRANPGLVALIDYHEGK